MTAPANLERPIQAEYEAVLNAPDRQERQVHLDRLVELLGNRPLGVYISRLWERQP